MTALAEDHLGSGACDMKGGVAVQLSVAASLGRGATSRGCSMTTRRSRVSQRPGRIAVSTPTT